MTPKYNHINQTNAGFSLVELLVTMGIMSVVIVGSMQVMDGHLKGQRSVRQHSDVNKLQLGLESFLNHLEVCTANFAGKNIAQLREIEKLVNTEGKVIYRTGDRFSNGSLELTSMQVSNFRRISGPGGSIDFTFTFKKAGDSTVSLPVIRTVQLPVTLANQGSGSSASNNGGTILSCGIGKMSERACIEMGGRYFPDAGTGLPRCTFRQIIVSPDSSVKSSKSWLHVNSSGMYPDVGNVGMGFSESDVWADGGSDGVVHISNTNDRSLSTLIFGWNHDPDHAPFESSSSTFPKFSDGLQIVMNPGRIGLGYRSYWNMRPSAPPTTPNISGTKLFVRNDIRITGDLYARNGRVCHSIQSAGGAPLTSDLRKKKNLESIDDALERLLKLDGVSYEWRQDRMGDLKMPEGRDYGLIAQNVEKVFPELVTNGPDGYKWVHYQKLIPVLIEGLKALNTRKDKVDREVQRLEADLAAEDAKLKEISKLVRDSK